jgi:hypothetical protein
MSRRGDEHDRDNRAGVATQNYQFHFLLLVVNLVTEHS